MLRIFPKLIENKSGTDRLLAFSDGVFAIAITLLILDVRLPDFTGLMNNTQLWNNLFELWPKYLAFIFSFLLIGQFWIIHHQTFAQIKYTNRGLLALNNILLLAISFIPFPTAVLSSYGYLEAAAIFYAVSLALSRLISTLLWLYAIQNGLLNEDTPPGLIKVYTLRSLVSLTIFLLSTLPAFIYLPVTYIMWGLIPVATQMVNYFYRAKDQSSDSV